MNTEIPSLRAVVFDAVGTLITPDPPAGDAYHRVGQRHGSVQPVEEVRRRFTAAFRTTVRSVEDPHRTDEPAEREFWRSVVETVFDELSPAAVEPCFLELFEHFADPNAWRVYPDVAPTLRQLRSMGLTVAVASNFDRRLHAVFDRHSDLAAIEHRFVSSEIGWRKPDARFFTTVCRELDCSPADVLYVGDDPSIDVAGAVAAGLPAILLRRSGPKETGVVSDLRELAGCRPFRRGQQIPGNDRTVK